VRGCARHLPLRGRATLALSLLTATVLGSAVLTTATAAAAPVRKATTARGGTAQARGSLASAFQAEENLFGAGQAGVIRTGLRTPGPIRSAAGAVAVASATLLRGAHKVGPLRSLLQADLLVVAPSALPAGTAARIRRLPGVVAAQQLDAARIEVNGKYVAMLGVDPSAFRGFAARPTARSTALWQDVADGGVAVSYTMGRQDRLPLGGSVTVAGARTEKLRVGGFGTVGIAGVDAVVSDAVARSLGIPAGNAIVISAPKAELTSLMAKVRGLLPRQAAIAPLVAQAVSSGVAVTSGAAGAAGVTAADGPGLSQPEVSAFLAAAVSRVGMPYVWGAAGPRAFDCSGLVQWSLARAGVVMPRVAVDQARTGPQVPVSQLQPGDLLFYHTDPTAPTYISHVAIYLGNGLIIQAPHTGLDVEIVPAIVGGPGFAGAVRVYPRVAAAVAANPAG
jgi:cell wall-associated NlpC family hydrolase